MPLSHLLLDTRNQMEVGLAVVPRARWGEDFRPHAGEVAVSRVMPYA